MPEKILLRGRVLPSANQRRKGKPALRTSPVKQKPVLFHGPSFSSGALIGAAIVLAAAYAPDYLRQSGLAVNTSDTAEQTPTVRFEFPLLRDTEVQGDPILLQRAKPSLPGEEVVYRVQAASFRKVDDADQLRALLLLQNLPVEMSTSQVNGQRWHRVVVGPFTRKLDAERAPHETA